MFFNLACPPVALRPHEKQVLKLLQDPSVSCNSSLSPKDRAWEGGRGGSTDLQVTVKNEVFQTKW